MALPTPGDRYRWTSLVEPETEPDTRVLEIGGFSVKGAVWFIFREPVAYDGHMDEVDLLTFERLVELGAWKPVDVADRRVDLDLILSRDEAAQLVAFLDWSEEPDVADYQLGALRDRLRRFLEIGRGR